MDRKSILEEAARIISGERDTQYGGPEDSFGMIASLWEPYIREKCVSDFGEVFINPDDVGILMALLKIARIATGQPKADNFVDLAGYAACAGEIALGGQNE